MTILSNKINLETSFPNFNRKLRLGIIGGGRIAEMQSMAARMTNRWDIVAGALSSDPKKIFYYPISGSLIVNVCIQAIRKWQ